MENFPERCPLAWAAGFFDGEGCFSLNPRKQLSTLITQNDPEPLYRFMGIVGVGHISNPVLNRVGNDQYQYRAHGFEKTQHIICLLWPYLCGPKLADAKHCLTVGTSAYRQRYLNKLSRIPKHGTNSRYNYKKNPCRCSLCRFAHAKAAREYKYERRFGEIQ